MLHGFDPITGSRRDGVTGRRHNRPPIASRITSEASFVGADSMVLRVKQHCLIRILEKAILQWCFQSKTFLGETIYLKLSPHAAEDTTARDCHIAEIAARGRMA